MWQTKVAPYIDIIELYPLIKMRDYLVIRKR